MIVCPNSLPDEKKEEKKELEFVIFKFVVDIIKTAKKHFQKGRPTFKYPTLPKRPKNWSWTDPRIIIVLYRLGYPTALCLCAIPVSCRTVGIPVSFRNSIEMPQQRIPIKPVPQYNAAVSYYHHCRHRGIARIPCRGNVPPRYQCQFIQGW
jgi:hypothetical protein